MNSIETNAWKKTKSSTENTLEKTDIKKVGCVIMASGLGKRFGGNKLMTKLGDKLMIQWILDSTKDLFDKRVVVTRSPEVKRLCEEKDIDVIFHSEPGRNDTVRLGLSYMSDNVDFCLFTPADQPFISSETLKLFVTMAQNNTDYIIRTGFGERLGAPIMFPKWTFEELLKLPEGKGGNFIVKKYYDKVDVLQVKCEDELEDIDTQEDLQRLFEKLK